MPEAGKISAGLLTRLRGAPPDSLLRVVLLLEAPRGAARAGPRQNPAARRAAVSAAQAAGERLLSPIDNLLKEHGGRRVSQSPGPLGAVTVEATPEGVRRLADSSYVRAVLEDQRLTTLE